MNTRELEEILQGKSHRSNLGKAWVVTKFLTSASWLTGKFIVKNTPTVLGAAWEIKRELTETIVEEYSRARKEQKELEIENQIKMLSHKGVKK